MGKLYLSNSLKNVIVTLGAYIEYMEQLNEGYTKTGKPKQLITYIRTATTWSRKAVNNILKELHPDEVEKLVGKDRVHIMLKDNATIRYMDHAKRGEVDKFEVVVKYKDLAVREYEKMKALETNTVIETSDLMDLIKLGLASCDVCESKGQDVEDCKHRKLLIKLDIQPINLEPSENDCPYRKES